MKSLSNDRNIIQLGKVTTHRLLPRLSGSDVVIHIDDTQPLIGIAHILLVFKSERERRGKMKLDFFGIFFIN